MLKLMTREKNICGVAKSLVHKHFFVQAAKSWASFSGQAEVYSKEDKKLTVLAISAFFLLCTFLNAFLKQT